MMQPRAAAALRQQQQRQHRQQRAPRPTPTRPPSLLLLPVSAGAAMRAPPAARAAAQAAQAAQAAASRPAALQRLLDDVAGTERGAQTSEATKARILSSIEELKALQAGDANGTAERLSATWRLLWTTEKETLFILTKAWLFGTRAGEVYQAVDVDGGSLQNVITFPPDGAFIVDSVVSPDASNAQRTNFSFTAAKLKVSGRDFKVPPFGQGWFQTVYVDGEVRVAEDVRGDVLVVARDGPPRVFT